MKNQYLLLRGPAQGLPLALFLLLALSLFTACTDDEEAALALPAGAANTEQPEQSQAPCQPMEMQNVWVTVQVDRRFPQLENTIKHVGFIDHKLEGKNDITFFAPSIEAVQKFLEKVGKTNLGQVDKKIMREIIRYHILISPRRTTDFGSMGAITTFQQEFLRYQTSGATIILNGAAKIIDPNIECTNGFLHVIDEVLIPPSLEPIEDYIN